MAKVIKYKFLSCEVNRGMEEQPIMEQIFLEKTMGWNEINEEIAKKEAHNGEYTIEDDGTEEIPSPSLESRVDTLEADSAEMAEALNMILSGVTE